MKKTKKHFGPRLVTWLLTFCLVLGLLPAQAMAATTDDDPSTWPAPDSLYTADGRNPVYLMVDFTDEDKGGIAASHYCDEGAELTPDIVKATATTSGYVKYTCSVCSSWAQINVPALTLSAFSLDPSYQGVVDNGVEFSGKPYTIVYDVVPGFHRFVGTELDNHVSVTSTGSYGIMITVDSAIYDNVELLTNERLVVYPKAIPWTAEFNSKVYDGDSLLDGRNVTYQDVNGSAVPAALSACDVKVVDGALTADTASPVANPVAAGPYAIGATITDTNYVWQTEKGKYNTVYTLTWIFPATNTIYVGDPITDVKLTTGNNLYSSPYNWTVDTGFAGFDSSKPGTTYVLTQVTKSSTSFGKVQIPVTVIARPILSVEEVVRSAPMGTPFNSLNLPATVTVTAEGGTGSAKTVSGVPVTWSDAGYDPYALTQSITGTLDVSRFPELSSENIPAFAATVNLTYGTVEAPTVNDYTKPYDGKATPLPMPSLPDGIKSVTISYNGSSNSGLPYSSSTPPTNAGTYTATVSYVMEQGYPQLSGVTVNYIISKAAQTCEAPTLASATTSSLTLNAVDNAEYSKDGQAWQDSPVFRNLDPGTTYTLYQRLKATDDGNYDASPAASAQFSTEYTTVDPGDLNLQPQSYPYTGNPIAYQVPTIPHVTKITVTYTVGGQETTTPPTNAGTYPVSISFTMQAGTAQLEPVTSSLTITKIKQAAPAAPTASSTGTNSITIAAIPGAVFSIDGGQHWQSGTLFEGLDPDTSYTIQAKYPEDQNHYESPVSSATFRTNRQSTSVPTVQSAVYTYDGTPKSLVADAPLGCDQVVQTFSGANGTSYGPTTTPPTNPGTYHVKVSYTMEAGYEEVQPQYANLTINKATPPVPPAPVVVGVTDHSITIQVEDGMAYSIDGGHTWQTSDTFGGLNRDTTYEIKVKAVETPCYKELEGPSTMQATDKTLVLLEKFTDQTVEYTGHAQTYTLPKGVAGLASMTVTGYDGIAQPPVNVGDYKVNIDFVAAEGYQLPDQLPAPVLHIIRPSGEAGMVRPVLADETVTYTGAPQRYHGADNIEGIASVSLVYAGIDGTQYDETSEAPTNAGTYSVTAYFSADGNHTLADGEYTATLTIRKAAQDTPMAALEDSTAHSLTASAVPGAEYSIDGGQTWQDSNIFTGLEANKSYTILVRMKEDENHLASSTRPVAGRTTDAPVNPLDQEMPAYHTVYNGSAQPYPYTDLLTGLEGVKSVSVMYVGTLTSGKPYESSDAPVNAGTYKVRFYLTAEDNYDLSAEQVYADMTISKAPQTMDAAPTITRRTTATIVLETVPGAEYSIDGGQTWQDSSIFTGLDPDTAYTFTQRLKETDNLFASESKSVEGRTLAAGNLKYEVDYRNEVIVYDPDVVEVGSDYQMEDKLPNGGTVIPGGTLYSRLVDGGNGEAGPVEMEVLPERPAAPDVKVNTTDMTMNTTTEMEYSGDGGKTWRPCEDNQLVEGYQGQTLLVRIAATDHSFRSEATEVHIPTRAAKPSVSLDTAKETLNTTAGMDYSTDGGKTWTQCTGPLDVSGMTGDTVLVRDHGDEDHFPSDTVEVVIPERRDAPKVEVDSAAQTVSSDKGTEWSADGGKTWNSLPQPLSTEEHKGQTLLFRYPCTDSDFASRSVTVVISRHPGAPVLVFDTEKEALSTTTDMEYSTDGGKTWHPCTDPLDVSDLAGKDVMVRYPGTDDTLPSETVTVTIPARRGAPNVGYTNETRRGRNDGTLTKTDKTMEYRLSGGEWKGICGSTVRGLAPGTYEVRYAATATEMASAIQTVTIGTGNGSGTGSGGTGNGSLLSLLNTTDHIAYIAGRTNTQAAPEANITRAEVAMILYRLLTDEARSIYGTSINRFSDVPRNAWYATAVSTLANIGLINGYPNGRFGPNDLITRGEVATILSRFFDVSEDSIRDHFSDIAGSWARDSINLAADHGLVNGFPDGTFRPDQRITRAEVIVMVNRILGRSASASTVLRGYKTFEDVHPGAWYYWDVIEASTAHDFTMSGSTEMWTVLW